MIKFRPVRGPRRALGRAVTAAARASPRRAAQPGLRMPCREPGPRMPCRRIGAGRSTGLPPFPQSPGVPWGPSRFSRAHDGSVGDPTAQSEPRLSRNPGSVGTQAQSEPRLSRARDASVGTQAQSEPRLSRARDASVGTRASVGTHASVGLTLQSGLRPSFQAAAGQSAANPPGTRDPLPGAAPAPCP
jgi:hypothetical protein